MMQKRNSEHASTRAGCKYQLFKPGVSQAVVTMPLVMMARGEEGRLGNRPMG